MRIALLFPELLGTYGDGGNAVVLAQRLAMARTSTPSSCGCRSSTRFRRRATSTCSAAARTRRRRSRPSDSPTAGWRHAVDDGAVVFAVCAGLQILGRTFTGADGEQQPGLGVLDCETRPKGTRQIGELVVRADRARPSAADRVREPRRHHRARRGRRRRSVGARRIGQRHRRRRRRRHRQGRRDVSARPGAGAQPGARRPLLSWVVGALDPLDDAVVDELRAERLAEALSSRRAGRST